MLTLRPLVFDVGPPPIINGRMTNDFPEQFPVGSPHNIKIEFRGKTGWCISDGVAVLARTGEWQYESTPSNRTEAFIKSTRYATPEEAMEVYRVWRDRMIREFGGKLESTSS